jgi:hypothetical protein
MPTVADEPCLTLCAIARQLDCHPSGPLRWITRGSLLSTGERLRLQAVRTPGGWRVRREDLDRFLSVLTADRLPAGSMSEAKLARNARVTRLKSQLAKNGF